MNHRLTLAAGAAVILASISEFAIISGAAWLFAAAGAVIVVALAGTLTRLGGLRAAIGAALLAAAASVPLFESSSPYLIAAGLVIVAACAASATGLRVLPVFADLVTYLAALLLYLNALLAGPQSAVRLLPTIGSLRHLVDLANAATALSKLPPPVPDTSGVQLLAAASIGVAAIVVDIIAVRLRRPAIAGLPLLVLFMAPITTAAKRGGIGGAFTFLAAAIGYMALLSADGRDRLRAWGRVVTVWHYAGEDERLGGAEVGALAATGRRIGLAAVCMALAVPLILPTVHVRQLFHGSGGGNGPGNQAGTGVRLPDPVDLLRGMITKSRNATVLTYRTSAVNPAQPFQPATQYLRVYVLNYDPSSASWRLMPPDPSTAVLGNLQPPPGLAAQGILTTTTAKFGDIDGYASPLFFLPVPYWPTAVTIPGSWRESNGTLMIFSGQGNRAGLTYTVTSQNPDPSPGQLEVAQHIPVDIRSAYLGFSSPVTNRLRAIAQRVTRGATNAFTKAMALENWFQSSNFSYSVESTIPDTPAGLLSFLTTNRQGFCQQFAFAMAVLARLVGIPSRIAIGYTAGRERADHSWVVTTGDAHAWPELYFDNVGWIRFEPTPGGANGQGTAIPPAWVTADEHGGSRVGPGGSTGPASTPSPNASPNVLGHVKGHNAPGDTGPAPAAPPPPASKLPLLLGLLAALLLVAAAPGTARLAVRGRRWHRASSDIGLADAAWREICDDLDDYGLAYRPSESPRAVARRVRTAVAADDPANDAVGRIAATIEQVRYALVPAPAGALRADVSLVRRGLARNASLTVRWQARLLPASTLGPARSAVRQMLGLLAGWVPSGSAAEGTMPGSAAG